MKMVEYARVGSVAERLWGHARRSDAGFKRRGAEKERRRERESEERTEEETLFALNLRMALSFHFILG